MTIEYKDSKRIVDTSTFADSYWQLHTSKLVNMGSSLGNEGTGAWTQAVWHKADDTNSVTVYEKYNSSPDNGFFLAGTQGSAGYYWVDYGVLQINSGVSPTVGGWDHIVVTRSSGGAFTIYVNGVSRATGTSTSDIDLSSDFRFATHASGQSNIADFSLWQRELTASEVLTLYNTAKIDSISQTNLTHHYDFAQTGSTLTDQVGSINGTRTGATGVLTRNVDNIKPTNVQNNSIFVETDTARRYWFDEATTLTFEDDLSSSTNWAGLSGAFSYDATNDEIDFNADTSGSSAYWNLGSTLSDTAWVMRMKVRLDTFSATSANMQNFTIGLSSTNGAYNTTQDSIGMLIRADGAGSKYKSTWGNDTSQNGNTSNFTRTPSAETIYLEIIRTSATGFTVNQYSDTAYSTLLESKVVTGVTATALQYVKLTTYSEATTNNMVGAITDVKVYDEATSVTPATWTMQPTFEDDTFSSGWTKTGTLVTANTSTNVLDWDSASSSNQATTYDIGYALSTKFIFRSKLIIDTITNTTSDSQQIYIGLFDASHGTSTSTAQDGFALYIISDTAGGNNKQYRIRVEGDGSTGFSNTAGDGGNYTKKPTAETIYVELVRNEDVFTINLYSDSGYSTLIETKSFTETNVTGLQYVGIKNYLSSANGALNGTLDDLEIYNGVTTPN